MAAGIGAALLMVICCAAPALVAAGALGALGAWLSNPWVIGAAIALAAAIVLSVLTGRSRRGQEDGQEDRDACCPPAPPTAGPGHSDQDRPAPTEGPRDR